MIGSWTRQTKGRVYRPGAAPPSRCGATGGAVAAAWLVWLASITGAAAALPAPEGARQLDPKQPVWVSADRKSVLVDGSVVLREGVLEMFACPAGAKEHESVVAVEAKPSLVHAGLLAVGAEEGDPVQFQPKYVPPTGSPIEVRVEWSEGGDLKSARAQEWVRSTETKKAMEFPFVFAGSGFWTDPDTGVQHYLADAGDFICVSNFAAAMLDVPAPSSQANGELWFEPFTERIPPVGTPVRLVLTPQPGAVEATVPVKAEPSALDAALRLLRSVGPSEGSTPAMQAAWRTVATALPAELPRMLGAMAGASPLAENWLRTAIDAVVDSAETSDLPLGDLVAFVRNPDGAPRARRTALEMVRRADAAAADKLLDELVDDASLEVRHEAVGRLLKQAGDAPEAERVGLLKTALRSARTLDQFEAAVTALADAGEEIKLAEELGFITKWSVVGPFDNRGGVGFAKVYPPEERLNLASVYSGHDAEGPKGPFGWKDAATSDRLGKLELNDGLGRHKGAVAYAWATIDSPAALPIEVRYATITASKLWVNGVEVASNETYHSGDPFDQYVARAELKPGANELLLKICQNEQTEPWAQEWPFQLRVTGPAGAPLEGVSHRDGGE